MTISEALSDYSLYLEVSEISVDMYPGNEDLQAFYVMALLKNGNYTQAFSIADQHLMSNEFKPLLAQTILFNDNENPDTLGIVEYVNSRKDPSFFEYLANLLGERSLLIDSALLWAKDGEVEKAYTLIKDLQDENLQELIALLAYDSGRVSEALLRLIELPSSDSIKYYNILLIADLFYLKENWARSRFYYEKAIELETINSAPYINISSIYHKSGNIKKSISFIEDGIDQYKNYVSILFDEIDLIQSELSSSNSEIDPELNKRLLTKKQDELSKLRIEYRELVLLSSSIYKLIKSDNRLRVIDDYRQIFKDDVKIELVQMKERNNILLPELFVANLWKLLNKDKDNREVSEYLIWYLLGIENYNDIELVMKRSENRYPNSNWTIYYRGILSGLKGDYEDSLTFFNADGLNIPSWELVYNKGVIQMAMKNYSEALTLFNKSIILINQENYINNINIHLSQIKTKIAQVLIFLNDIDEAIRVLNSAYELDPDNYSSDLLKSIHLNLKDNR